MQVSCDITVIVSSKKLSCVDGHAWCTWEGGGAGVLVLAHSVAGSNGGHPRYKRVDIVRKTSGWAPWVRLYNRRRHDSLVVISGLEQ